jgi:SecD/SecF fusion protein
MLRGVLAAASAAIVLAGVGCNHGAKQQQPHQGEVIRLKAVPSAGHNVTSDDLDRSVEIMQRRLDKLGADAGVRRQGADVIIIELPVGVHVPKAAATVAGKTALLEFYDFEADLTGPSVSGGLVRAPVATPSLFALLSHPATRALASNGTPSHWFLFDAHHRVAAGPVPRKRLLGSVGPSQRIFAVPMNTVVLSCDTVAGNCLSTRQIASKKGYYLVKQSDDPSSPIPEMTGADLKLSGTRADIDPASNAPVVLVQFTGRGQRIFHELTRREAERGALACAGQRDREAVMSCAQHFAIVLDHEIQSVPYIDFVQNPDGIPGDNGVQIELGAGSSIAEAKRLAAVLQTGALPVQFVRLP